jgi:hypothetical protein
MNVNKGRYVSGTNTTYAIGSIWQVCMNLSTALTNHLKCNGGAIPNSDASASVAPPNRVVYRVNNSAVIIAGATSLTMTWNHDILVQAQYHSAWTATEKTDGSAWCSGWKNETKADGTEIVLKSSYGFNGRTKCTWLLVADTSAVAPTIAVKDAATYNKFLFQWTEWLNNTGLGTGGVLPANDSANFYLGAYAVTDGTFLNPMVGGVTTDANWPASLTFWSEKLKTPASYVPGSIGKATYYPAADGPHKDTQILEFDSIILFSALNNYKNAINTFNTAKSAYDTKKTAYDTAVDKFTKREADFFAKAFTAEENIPTRPDAPARPDPYTLPNFGLAAAAAAPPSTWKSTATAQGNTAHLAFSNTDTTVLREPSPISANR